MTLNEIVDLIHGFAVAHKSLRGNFYEGYDENFETGKDQLYPCLLMNILPTTKLELVKTFKFEIGVLDKVDTDRSNRLNVQSDTEQICDDLVAFLWTALDVSEIQLPIDIEHVEGVFGSDLAGSMFPMNISTFSPVSLCAAPIELNAYLTETGEEFITESGETLILN